MKKYRSELVFLLILVGIFFTTSLPAGDKDIIRIGIVVDGSWEQSRDYLNLIKNEIIDLTRDEFDVSFPEDKQKTGDWNPNRIAAVVTELLSDEEVDIIITPGVIASDEIAHKDRLNKPVIAPFILDLQMQSMPFAEGVSGRTNLSYIHTPFTSRNTLLDFKSVVEFKNMAFLFNAYYLEKIPLLEKRVKELAEDVGINLYAFAVEQSIDEIIEKFPDDIEAVYISPLLHIPDSEFAKLIEELIKRKLPSFSLLGVSEVERGVLTTNRPDIFPRIARRIALTVQRILLGEEAGEIPVYFSPGEQITINMRTARAINIYPNVAVLTEAELLNEEETEERGSLDIIQVINEAISVNLDILAKMKYVSAGSRNIHIARSELLPQVDISALGLFIDKDRAEASLGSQPQRTLSGTAMATQLIYSEPAWANFAIQKSIQASRESELAQLRLDIAIAASTAFLNVLRAQNFERIQKENLKTTKSNLEMARVRESIGSAEPSEVYRWESEMANNRNSVIKILADRNIAQIQLNRLLNRNLDDRTELVESNPYTVELSKADNFFMRYLNDPRYFAAIQDFLVKEGIKNSPELTALEQAIAARSRERTSVKNSFWSPTFALKAEYTSVLAKSGVGSNPPDYLPASSVQDDNFWNIGLSLSFPLLEGGKKFARLTQTNDALEQLHLQRQSAAEKIEQQIRSVLYKVYASFASITQTNLAAEAADRSLQVVVDGYARGMVSILDLLDAQNTALVSKQLASNAVYDFIIDLMSLERSIGNFYFLMSDSEARTYLQNFTSHLNASGLRD